MFDVGYLFLFKESRICGFYHAIYKQLDIETMVT